MRNGAVKGYAGSLAGATLFALAFNLFVVPLGLYSGTLTGVAQMLNAVLVWALPAAGFMEWTGALLLVFNIPLFILAWRDISREFFFRSLATTVWQSFVMTVIPVPGEPLVADPLTSCLVAGAICGWGAGFTLRCGGSGGGTDILGLLLAKRLPNFSVGSITLVISGFVFLWCLVMYQFPVVVYSALFTITYSFVLDKTHLQNIKCSATIVSRRGDIAALVQKELQRGATCWQGTGAYTGQGVHVYLTVLSKYEAVRLEQLMKVWDPGAFLVFTSGLKVVGNFEKRL